MIWRRTLTHKNARKSVINNKTVVIATYITSGIKSLEISVEVFE